VAREVEPCWAPTRRHNVAVLRQALKRAVLAAPVDTELQSLRRTLLGLACDADVVLDLHCDAEAVMHSLHRDALLPACEPLARFLGAQLALLAQESGDSPSTRPAPGLVEMGERLGERFPIPQACLSVTVELRGATDVTHELAAQDAATSWTFCSGAASSRRAADAARGRGRRAPAGRQHADQGRGRRRADLPEAGGRRGAAGEVLAHVIDPLSAQVHELKSPVDGLFFARDPALCLRRHARGQVAGREALRTGKLLGA
jgi:predicted deacylase